MSAGVRSSRAAVAVAAGATARLAAAVAGGAPASARDLQAARASLFDTACAIAAGSGSALSRRLREVAELAAGSPDGGKAEWAAWVAGGLAAADGLDDHLPYGAAGAPVWPALLVLDAARGTGAEDAANGAARGSEAGRAPGGTATGAAHGAGAAAPAEPLLEAWCVGVGGALAVWRAGGFSEADRGFDGGAVFGALAATLAGARLLGLDAAQVAAAVAIAASEAGGVLGNLGSDADALHIAAAARTGARAVLLASRGWRGAPDVLEARQGFGEAFMPAGEGALEGLAAALAAAGLADELRVKHVAGHVELQRPVLALLALLDGLDGAAVDAATVEVAGLSALSGALRFDAPASADEARASLRGALARVLDERGGGARDDANGAPARRPAGLGGLLDDANGAPARRPAGLGGLLDEDAWQPPSRNALARVTINALARWQQSRDHEPADRVAVTLDLGDGERRTLACAELPATVPDEQLAAKWTAVARARARHDAGAARRVEELVACWEDAGGAPAATALAARLAVAVA